MDNVLETLTGNVEYDINLLLCKKLILQASRSSAKEVWCYLGGSGDRYPTADSHVFSCVIESEKERIRALPKQSSIFLATTHNLRFYLNQKGTFVRFLFSGEGIHDALVEDSALVFLENATDNVKTTKLAYALLSLPEDKRPTIIHVGYGEKRSVYDFLPDRLRGSSKV